MAFKAPHHQGTTYLDHCLQLGGEEHFAMFTHPSRQSLCGTEHPQARLPQGQRAIAATHSSHS